ncbi:MAG: helix-turn-helix transcriptional regulator [Leptospirales bacterium]
MFVYFGGYFGVILAVGQLARPTPLRFTSFALYLMTAMNLVYSMLFYSGAMKAWNPFSLPNILHLCILYAIGPLVYYFLDSILTADDAPRRGTVRIHFAPAALVFVMSVVAYAVGFWSGEHEALRKLEAGLYAGSGVHALVYVAAACLRRILPLLNAVSIRREPATIHLIVFGALAMAITVSAVAAQFSGSGRRFFIVTCLLTSVLFCWTFFLQQSGRDFAELLKKESLRLQYRKSNLSGIDAQAVAVLLARVMQAEQPFRRDDLSLRDLAGLVDLTAHQLSEVLNVHLDRTFAGYLTEYRLSAAKTELIQEPDRTVLDVGLNCGFGSKSAFNSAFLRGVGMTPTAYRKHRSLPGL